jgi:hypothetical protein
MCIMTIDWKNIVVPVVVGLIALGGTYSSFLISAIIRPNIEITMDSSCFTGKKSISTEFESDGREIR